jgi:hypothetical protein
MDQRRVAKKICGSKSEGRRKVGRPRLRWLDDVENYLRVMKVKRWRIKSQNREEWASVVKEAKVLKGPEQVCPSYSDLGCHFSTVSLRF